LNLSSLGPLRRSRHCVAAFKIIVLVENVDTDNSTKPVVFPHMGQKASELKQLIVYRELQPRVSISSHLVGHYVVTDGTKSCLKYELLLGLTHFW
jgi:hypothetical protein